MKARSAAVRALTTLAVSVAVLTGPLAPTASATDRYVFANGCYAMRTIVSHKFVVKNSDGSYAATAATKEAATPFRMQATALGRYLLYGPDGSMPAVGLLNKISATKTPGPAADWVVDTVGLAFVLKSFQTGQGVRSGTGGVLGLVATDPEGMAFEATTGCANFPEVQVNVTGTPLKGATPTSPVRGFIDDHIHLGAFDFLGGRFHCGRPWSPYGVTVALTDCPDHFPNGAGAVFENFLASGSPVGTHSTDGWPTFAGWPRDESQTHEGTYWKWIERAWRSGLRIMVNDLVENRALCDLYPLKKNNCNEMTSAYKQADDMQALQDYIDAQFGGPGKGFFRIVKSSAEARKVINAGKLAVVLGVEESEVLNCGQTNGTPKCTAASDRQRAQRSLQPRRPFAVPGPQVRQRARRHQVRRRHLRGRGERREQVRHGAVLGRQPLRRRGPRQRAHQPRRAERAAGRPVRSGGGQPAALRPAAGLSPRAAVQPQGAHPPGRSSDPLDDEEGHDRRDRSHEREDPPADALDPRGRRTTRA